MNVKRYQFCDASSRRAAFMNEVTGAPDLMRDWVKFSEYAALEGENERLKEENKTLRRIPLGEVWYWQGDGEDYPESLICPVIMEPDVLRKILVENERLKEQLQESHNVAFRWQVLHQDLRDKLDILKDQFQSMMDAPNTTAQGRVYFQALKDIVEKGLPFESLAGERQVQPAELIDPQPAGGEEGKENGNG